MATCTAPVEGHQSPAAAALCPVCSPTTFGATGSLPAPTIPGAPTRDPEFADALLDALAESSTPDWETLATVRKRLALSHIETFVAAARLGCPALESITVSTEAVDEYGPTVTTTMACGCDGDGMTAEEWATEHGIDSDKFESAMRVIGAQMFEDSADEAGFEALPHAYNGYVMDIKEAHFATLGVEYENDAAKAALSAHEWWTFTRDSQEVKTALIVHANP